MKTYRFGFGSLKAEFNDGMVCTIFDGTTRYREVLDMTWPEAQAYFHDFLKKVEDGPAQAFMTCYSNPKPRGYKTAVRSLDKKE